MSRPSPAPWSEPRAQDEKTVRNLDQDTTSKNLTFKKINDWVHIDKKSGTHCYVFFIPECAYKRGSRTFTQFNEHYQHDERLFELFCCLAYRKNGIIVSVLLCFALLCVCVR